MTNPAVQRQIERDVKAGLVVAASLATPCASCPASRKRAFFAHSAGEPWGLKYKTKF